MLEIEPKEVCWKTPADSGGVKAQGLPTLPPNCLLQWPERGCRPPEGLPVLRPHLPPSPLRYLLRAAVFSPGSSCLLPSLLHSRWQRDLLEMQVWSYCLPAETCQGFPIALSEKRPESSPSSLRPSCCVPSPPWLATSKFPQDPSAVPTAAIPSCFLAVWGSLQSQGLGTCCAHSVEQSLPSLPAQHMDRPASPSPLLFRKTCPEPPRTSLLSFRTLS